MKAWRLYGINDLRYEEGQRPSPEAGQVLLNVKAAGICGSDIQRVFETGAHRHPLVIGHEFSGVVEEVGPEVDEAWLQKRVGVFPLIPSGKCGPLCWSPWRWQYMPCVRGSVGKIPVGRHSARGWRIPLKRHSARERDILHRRCFPGMRQ